MKEKGEIACESVCVCVLGCSIFLSDLCVSCKFFSAYFLMPFDIFNPQNSSFLLLCMLDETSLSLLPFEWDGVLSSAVWGAWGYSGCAESGNGNGGAGTEELI